MIVVFAFIFGAYLVYSFYKSQGHYDKVVEKDVEYKSPQNNLKEEVIKSDSNNTVIQTSSEKPKEYNTHDVPLSFEDGIKILRKVCTTWDIRGPLSNGDYSINFNRPTEDLTKIIIFPNLEQDFGEVVMDLIVIPQNNSYEIINEYDITYLLKNDIPGKQYLYDSATIERSMSRTACIRLSFDQNILKEIEKFIGALYYLNENSHEIFMKLAIDAGIGRPN